MKLGKTAKWWIKTLIVPVVLLVLGYFIPEEVEKKKIDLEYIKMATNILSDKNSDIEMKAWAVNVLNEYSKVKFSKSTKTGLKEGRFMLTSNSYSNETEFSSKWKVIDSITIKN